jgi:hypothetical protein
MQAQAVQDTEHALGVAGELRLRKTEGGFSNLKISD